MADFSVLEKIIYGRVEPHIYAFETNTIPNFLKVGDTYRPVEIRLEEWRKIYSNLVKKYEALAKVDEKTYFRDYSVHDFLEANGFRRIKKDDVKQDIYISNEFFKDAKKENVEEAIKDIHKSFNDKDNRYSFYDVDEHLPLGDFDFERDADWNPRKNQQDVIDKFMGAYNAGRKNLLMYAVMRFGKSFTSLCCAKAMNAKLIVVVCGKTAVSTEWKENVQRPKILDGFEFVDSNKMKAKPTIVSEKLTEGKTVVVFLTMQDLLGEEIKNKHQDLFTLNENDKLDLLIIDETHFGARAEKYGQTLGYDDSVSDLDEGIKVFKPNIKLHLSGTPYRILLENEFESNDIVGMVQYSDIINAKEEWDKENIDEDEWENPYYGFPQMVRFAFHLNKSSIKALENLQNNGYAYDLTELFAPKSTSKTNPEHNQFKHKEEVLDLLRSIDGSNEDKNIFGFLNYDKIKNGNMCRHIVMVLPNCASCDAMAILLKEEQFNNLNEYEILNVAGFDAERAFLKNDYALKVKERIEKLESENKKTITLTVGKMMTGCTVKEWDTMIFLRNTSSPQDYDQATFRLQSQYIKTIESTDGKIIKYNMKPQTLLVDFDPVRMYTLMHKKSLIALINSSERGNEILEKKLKRELEIAPIININHDKLRQMEAADIVDAIRNYNANKSMLDETFDIEIDYRIFDNEEIKAIIEKQPEITNNGINFEHSPYDSDEEGDELDDDSLPSTSRKTEDPTETDPKEKSEINEENETKMLSSKLQGYYFKLLLFAFLSENREKSISDIISSIECNEDGKRIANHLQINVDELKIVREKINPTILNYLENKIQNIDELGSEKTADKIKVALKKMSRLSESEIVTPSEGTKLMVDSLPESLNAESKFLDIAAKTGEFAFALVEKYGNNVKNNIYSIATSGVTYECTRKIYNLLGLPVEHIFTKFTSYDLINTEKNSQILKELKTMNFDAIIGNPPYQVMANGDANGSDAIYNLFIDVTQSFGNNITLLHPAKFLFNSGKTPKPWNKKMLNDEHFRIIHYWPNSSELFPTIQLPGGIVISEWNRNISFGKIDTFVPFEPLKNALEKVNKKTQTRLDSIIYPAESYNFTQKLHDDNPNIAKRLSKGHMFDLKSPVLEKLPDIFLKEKPNDEYVQIYGRIDGNRDYRWIKKEYLEVPDNFEFYKVFLPDSNGSGAIGESESTQLIGEPFIGNPLTGATQTFLSIGKFKDKISAEKCMTYIKSKFARAILGTLKVTQHNPRTIWKNVPIQDFTKNSDIDWNKSISKIDTKAQSKYHLDINEIDAQLYAKYNLSADEIDFIEKNIKPME